MRKTILFAFALVVVLAAKNGIGPSTFGQETKKAGAAKKATGNDAASKAGSNAANKSADIVTQLAQAQTTAVGQPLNINGKSCGPTGGPKPGSKTGLSARAMDLNRNKNRTDDAKQPVSIQWQQLKTLPSNSVAQIQGAPVTVVGFLSHQIKVESAPGSTGESTNCYFTAPVEVDWHMYLTSSANQGIANAIIVETTPRVRPLHQWDKAKLDAFVNTTTQVRITGWLLYDWEHIDVIGTERATVWEVHPITKIEVQINGTWKDALSLN
jgi:hypothetical protein